MSDDLDPDARLRQLVQDIRTDVAKAQDKHAKAQDKPVDYAVKARFPDPKPYDLASTIGVIIDKQHTAAELSDAGLINTPAGLSWLSIKTFKDFKAFLDTKGVPAYISFGGSIVTAKMVPQKDTYQCAKLLCDKASELGLAKLPEWEVHCPVITKKKQIELLLFDYKPKSGKNGK